MHISKIELENIKSHAHATFEFTRGTTAITGENGAGKTTIIEAIAWALFDLLDYKKEDFVRRGTKKGWVEVTFQSGLDDREYVVYRDSGAGYHVTDPRLNTRLAVKKDEVVRFLWQHLGLEPGTDLKSLFRQAIGVPQGTFTAIFLEGATERKVAFDRLLKVEEYRQAAEKLRETAKYLDTSVATIREQIARAEGELARADLVEREVKDLNDQAVDLGRHLAILEAEIAEKRELVTKLNERERIDNAMASLRAESKYALERLDSIAKAKIEIDALEPKISQQEELEAEAAAHRDKLAAGSAIQQQVSSLTVRINKMREAYKDHKDRLKEAEAKAESAGLSKALEERTGALIREIAEARAHLERDQKFQKEIKGGFCPVISERCLNMKPGQTLETFLSSQFAEVSGHIATLESEHLKLSADLSRSREAERFAAILDDLRKREEELRNEGVQLAAEKKELEARTAGLQELEASLRSTEARLRDLNDPRSRVRYLAGEVAAEAALRESVRTTQEALDKLEEEKRGFDTAIADHAHSAAEERSALHSAEKRQVETQTTLASIRGREQQLVRELARFAELRMSLSAEFQEKERLESVAEATAFIRDTLKEAAPRVARNYVYHVSIEANQMFREIMGDGSRSLKWAEDYAVVLEEDGYERPFASLSGGEQMAGALAIRLGLLKQLTDVRIAFFDEPTTNMDLERRENLAQQISRITNFDQLFVISHDETFDNFVDNVIEVRRGEEKE